MSPHNDLIPLPDAARETAVITGGPTKPYTTFYRAAMDGKIPVIRADNGRYFVERSRLPAIADILGLRVQS